MFKKILVLIFAFLLVLNVIIFASGCDKEKPERIAVDNIYSDTGYVDYAKEAFYDIEKYPELASHGLFWTKWNDETQAIERVRASTQEGAALVDPSKPTVIFVHGMMAGSYGLNSQENFYLSSIVTRPAEFGLDSGRVSLIKLWMDEGWNVAVYIWNAFSAEGLNFGAVEAKIWSVDGSQKVSHRNPSNELVYGASEYSIAENFAADYIRAMRLLPSTMGDNEIRVTGHSMGGVLSTTSVFLINELARNGQLPIKQAPDRLALLDPGFGVKIVIEGKTLLSSETDFTINWSKKPLYNKGTSETMIELVKDMTASGIVIEYYAYKSSWAMVSIPPEILTELNTYSTFVFLDPDYGSYNSRFNYANQAHTMIHMWYLTSIAFPPVKDITDGEQDGVYALSASTPTDYMKNNFVGVRFNMAQGEKTLPSSDDLFVRVE